MIKERPEHVRCVQHFNLDLKGKSWCGRNIECFEWSFLGVDHAAENGRQKAFLVACKECTDKIIESLREGQ